MNDEKDHHWVMYATEAAKISLECKAKWEKVHDCLAHWRKKAGEAIRQAAEQGWSSCVIHCNQDDLLGMEALKILAETRLGTCNSGYDVTFGHDPCYRRYTLKIDWTAAYNVLFQRERQEQEKREKELGLLRELKQKYEPGSG